MIKPGKCNCFLDVGFCQCDKKVKITGPIDLLRERAEEIKSVLDSPELTDQDKVVLKHHYNEYISSLMVLERTIEQIKSLKE